MVRDKWTPLAFGSLREGLCGVIQYHQVLREREEESERRQLPLRGRVHPSLPLYTHVNAQTQVGTEDLPLRPLAFFLWSNDIPSAKWLAAW